jgi:ketosteroid isomerase-like protein
VTRQALLAGVVFTYVLAVGACSSPPAAAPAPAAETAKAPAAPVSSTADVLAHHQKTFGASDVEGVLADYAPDAIMFTPGGPVRGTDALRKTFQTLFAEWGKPGTTFEMKQQTVDGDHAYTFWNAETADNKYEAGSDAFVVHNGKIVAHFFSAKITAKKH